MIRIDTPKRRLQVVLAGAITTRQIPVFVSFIDRMVTPHNGPTPYDGSTVITNTNSTTAVNVCISHKDNPPNIATANIIRDIDSVVINNVDTAAATVTVSMDDNGTSYTIIKAVLAVGDMLVYSHDSGWHCLDTNGNTKFASTGAASVSGTLAQFAATTSAQLAGVISDETGSGALVFATSPTLVTPTLGAATATSVSTGTLTETTGEAFTDYTPTASAETGTWGSLTVTTARYRKVGKLLILTFQVNSTVSTGSPTQFRLSLPSSYTLKGTQQGAALLYVSAREVGYYTGNNGDGYIAFSKIPTVAFTGTNYVIQTLFIEIN